MLLEHDPHERSVLQRKRIVAQPLPMTDSTSRTKARTYALLLVLETLAALIILWSTARMYHAVAEAIGHQLAAPPDSPLPLVVSLILFHCVYWYRLLRVPVAVTFQSLLGSHIVLFVGRLCFILGTSFFALLILRHLPSLTAVPDPVMLTMRFVAALITLFSLYCYSADLERLGIALRPPLP